ncbi:hypothetical protein S40285_08814 [Stachybotrys chlorohalonatus IBT 40285]|uniref:PA14 domain-containing protein n=1 Tax=Stachybotrys chlorohalonatus (strain IBT 40285) TaxID=1283841 RepID=A0A084QD23_STAC4|nr:hypothetical protein S40285_08814 [Stachybotrys chlorohalonata IBT 40285]
MKFTAAIIGFGLAIFTYAGPCNNNRGRQVIGTSNKNPALPERHCNSSRVFIVPTTATAAAATETLPAATCTQELEFAVYAIPANSLHATNLKRACNVDQLSINFDLQFGGVEPDITGVTRICGKAGPAGTTMGRSMINHRGYLAPSTLGLYAVYLDAADDALYSWPTGFSRQAAFMFPRFKLPSLTSIPLRFVWVNEGGPDAFHFRLVDPTGKPLVGPATPKSPQVIASCSDNGLPVPAWPS